MRALDAGIIVCDECQVDTCAKTRRSTLHPPRRAHRTPGAFGTASRAPGACRPLRPSSHTGQPATDHDRQHAGQGHAPPSRRGVVELAQADMLPIALVVFVASILVLTFKLIGIALPPYSAHRHRSRCRRGSAS